MKNLISGVLLVNGINGTSIAVLTLNDVKDIVAITLGVVSTISTLLIIRETLRKARAGKRGGAESTGTRGGSADEIAVKDRPASERNKSELRHLSCYGVLIGCLVFAGCSVIPKA